MLPPVGRYAKSTPRNCSGQPARAPIAMDCACYIVRDANGRALAYVYFEEEPGRRTFGQAAHPRPP
jgi:hypothetical protein